MRQPDGCAAGRGPAGSMFHSEMWAVRLPEGNASVAARHVNSGRHSASGLAEMAGDGFDLRSVFSGGIGLAGSLIARCDCRLLTAWRLNSRTQIVARTPDNRGKYAWKALVSIRSSGVGSIGQAPVWPSMAGRTPVRQRWSPAVSRRSCIFEYLYFRKQLVNLREGEKETCERSLRPWRWPAF